MPTEKGIKQPLVSVLMTTYNREKYVAEAIESVLASSYQNCELIIVDDRSSDNTVSIIKNYLKKDKRVKLFINEKNLGDYPNRNKAASYAKGEYIVIVDSDDWMFKDALIKWVEIMVSQDASFGIFTDKTDGSIERLSPKESITRHFFEKPILAMGPIATIIKTEYFKLIKGFPVFYGPANDMYYNLKAAMRTNTLIFPFPLVDYRLHEGQEINNKYSYLYNNYRYLRDALNELNLPLSVEEKTYLQHKNNRRFIVNIFKYLSKTGNISKALIAIRLTNFKWHDFADALVTRSIPVRANKS